MIAFATVCAALTVVLGLTAAWSYRVQPRYKRKGNA